MAEICRESARNRARSNRRPQMRTTWIQHGLVAAIVLAASSAMAQPQLLPVQGVLTDDSGAAIDAVSMPFTFALYDDEVGGVPFFEETTLLAVNDGLFSYYVGLTDALDLSAFEGQDVFVGISVNFESELAPRTSLGTVAYAAYAGGVRWDDILDIPADIADGDDDTTYVGASPISVTGTTISLATVGCAAGQTWVYNGTSWACSTPTPFGIGSGLIVDDGTLRVDSTVQRALSSNCTAGSYLRGFAPGGAPLCETPASVTYAAGAGLILSSNEFAADTAFLQRRLQSHNCPFGIQSVSGTGSVTCAADNNTDTTYTGGTGINVNPTTRVISANLTEIQARIGTTSCPFGIQSIAQNGAVTCAAQQSSTTYTANTSQGLTLTGTQFGINHAIIQRRLASHNCTHGIRQVAESGAVTCAAAPTIAGGSCGANQYVTGINSNGSPICGNLRNEVRRHASEYIRNSCVIWIGWSDLNRTCCDRVNHGGLQGTGGRAGVTTHRRWYIWPGWENLQLTGLQTSGDVDANDWFYVGLHCPAQ